MHQLPKTLSSRVNRFVHKQALQHEQRIKSELVAQLLKARTEGAPLAVLAAMLDKLEAATPAG